MGVGVADFDADGLLDIVRTNFSEQVTTLYKNHGGTFTDVSVRAGLGVNRRYLGFGVDFFDYDNDGWKDIFVANGHVYAQLATRKLHLTYRQPKVIYRNLANGDFTTCPRPRGRRFAMRTLRGVAPSGTSTTTATWTSSSTISTVHRRCFAMMAATGRTRFS
jgi:hypothetical protein